MYLISYPSLKPSLSTQKSFFSIFSARLATLTMRNINLICQRVFRNSVFSIPVPKKAVTRYQVFPSRGCHNGRNVMEGNPHLLMPQELISYHQ